ncbi:MAG: MFS transporter [Clostridia bacterium]
MPKQRRYPWRFALFLVAYYVANSVYQGYITVYFRSIGLDTKQIGLLMSAVPLVSIATQPLWGAIGDRCPSRARLLCVMSLAAAGAMIGMLANNTFWYLMGMIGLFSATFTAIQPMGDSVILEDLSRDATPFGPMRLLGSLSFAASSLAAGWLLQDKLYLVSPLTAGMLVLTAMATFLLPKAPGRQRANEKGSMLALFKRPDLAPLLVLLALLQMTMGYFYAFFPVYFTELPGGGSGLLGACYLISAVSELPFLLLCDRLFEKLGAGKLLLSAAVAMTARWLILAAFPVVPIVMASQILHGWCFIVMTVTMAKYINQSVPEAFRARGQMLLSIVSYGFARVAGSMGGGLVADAMGIGGGFYVMAATTLLSILLFAKRYLRAPRQKG